MSRIPDIWREMERPFEGLFMKQPSPFRSWRPLLRQLDDLFTEIGRDLPSLASENLAMPKLEVEDEKDHYLPQNVLCKHVAFIPEAATMLFTGGFWRRSTPIGRQALRGDHLLKLASAAEKKETKFLGNLQEANVQVHLAEMEAEDALKELSSRLNKIEQKTETLVKKAGRETAKVLEQLGNATSQLGQVVKMKTEAGRS